MLGGLTLVAILYLPCHAAHENYVNWWSCVQNVMKTLHWVVDTRTKFDRSVEVGQVHYSVKDEIFN